MKKMLIITGPQGSGNHMWSKVLGETPEVQGWDSLLKQYWVSHAYEPLNHIWEDPTSANFQQLTHDYYVTSISCPYTHGGPNLQAGDGGRTPKYDEFIEQAKQAGFIVSLAVIGRDFNILEHQQTRLRGQHTTPWFKQELEASLLKHNPIFISTELLYLYRIHYLNQLSRLLNFPIFIDNDKLEDILKDNANGKYIKPVEHYWLDDIMRQQAEDKLRSQQ